MISLPDLLFTASFLVDRDRAREFSATVTALSGVAGTRLTLSGPCAPYAFTSLDGEPAA